MLAMPQMPPLSCCPIWGSQALKHWEITYSSHWIQLIDIKFRPASGSFIFFLVLEEGRKAKQRQQVRRNSINIPCPTWPTTSAAPLSSCITLYKHAFLHSELTNGNIAWFTELAYFIHNLHYTICLWPNSALVILHRSCSYQFWRNHIKILLPHFSRTNSTVSLKFWLHSLDECALWSKKESVTNNEGCMWLELGSWSQTTAYQHLKSDSRHKRQLFWGLH